MTRDYDIHPDEVNELRAEVERLKVQVDALEEAERRSWAEVEQLKKDRDNWHINYDRQLAEVARLKRVNAELISVLDRLEHTANQAAHMADPKP
jgi:molecular chaperone GrpE (heat shock protein)